MLHLPRQPLQAKCLNRRRLWQTYMLPDNGNKTGEYAGAAIWGSSPSIDESRNHVYIATGNLCSAPFGIRQCQEEQNNQTTPISDPNKCVERTTQIPSWPLIWTRERSNGIASWEATTFGFSLSTPNCPPGPNPDVDFSEAPMILSVNTKGTKRDIVVAVQKSGFAWALDRDNGDLVWFTEAGPRGAAGGGYWGAATDEKRVYTNIANSGTKNFTLKPSAKNTTAGGWVAMDARSGIILWSTADPINATASGPVSVANGVLFAGSTNKQGPIYPMNAKTGRILRSYATGATMYGGVSVSDGCFYVGNGYSFSLGAFLSYTSGTSLFAFCIP